MSFNNNDKRGNKNMIIAMALFIAVMWVYNHFSEKEAKNETATETSQASDQKIRGEEDSSEVSSEEASSEKISVDEAIVKKSRISFENGKMKASVDLEGGVIDSVILKDFKETIKEDSSNVRLFTPKGTDTEYYYAISYKDKTHNEKLDNKTVWTLEHPERTSQSVVLKAKTDKGLIIERTITLDDAYVISVKDKIINVSGNEIQISKSAELIRSHPKHNNYAVVHEGIVGNSEGKVEEIKYSKIGDKTSLNRCGWFGYTDIYWLCSIINKDKNSIASYSKIGDDSYKCSVSSKADIKIATDSAVELNYALFTGPKDLSLLKGYEKALKLEKFDMAIDFGWFFLLTKPLLSFLELMADWFKNMGLVILALTLLFKIATYPLMKKSFKSAAKMREVQPKVAALQKLYAHDKMRINQELMALYKKEQVSPMSGCVPMLLQAPIFFCLYKVFFISIQMRQAPLFGWIHDLSAPDPLYIANLFGAIDWTPPSFLQIGVWPLIMGMTMFLQQKLSTAKSDSSVEKSKEAKMQENMMLIMPVMFTYICASFPVGVVVYWTISNIFSIIQQYYANTHTRKARR